MMPTGTAWLTAAGFGSLAAALVHVAAMIAGPGWFRFFGAPERLVRGVERGNIYPYVVTIGIVIVLLGWAAFAFSAAGQLPRLPLLRTGLVLISGVCLLRGMAAVTPLGWLPEHSTTFRFVSSFIVFILGVVFATGTWMAWPMLSGKALS
jgi:hypothetical protein